MDLYCIFFNHKPAPETLACRLAGSRNQFLCSPAECHCHCMWARTSIRPTRRPLQSTAEDLNWSRHQWSRHRRQRRFPGRRGRAAASSSTSTTATALPSSASPPQRQYYPPRPILPNFSTNPKPTLVVWAQDGEDREQDLLAAAARGAPFWHPLPRRS